MDELMGSNRFEQMSKADQNHIIEQRDSLQQQLDMAHSHQAGQPNFSPVDARAIAAKVDNMGEGADQVHAVVKPVYQKLDELSEGRFGTLREQQKRTIKQMYSAASEDAFDKAAESNADATRKIQDIFDQNRVNIRPQEYSAAQQGYATEMRMREIHEAVEGSFNRSAPADIAAKLGQERTIDGNKLTDNINRLISKGKPEEANARAAVEQVIGKDGLENYYRMGDLFSRGPISEPIPKPEGIPRPPAIPKPPGIPKPAPPKPLTRSQTANAADALMSKLTLYLARRAAYAGATHVTGLPWWAAVGVSATEDVGRWAMQKVATTPHAGVMLDYAVRHQVADKWAVPLIAAAMGARKQEKENGQEEEPTETQ
jgi:hypothetical protein